MVISVSQLLPFSVIGVGSAAVYIWKPLCVYTSCQIQCMHG